MSDKSEAETQDSMEDLTLGGYLKTHKRPPAYEGSDGFPYTVSIEVEQTGDLRAPVVGYLVFPRWADTGVGIVGHLETPVMWKGASKAEVESAARASTLMDVKKMLEHAILSDTEDGAVA